jgi:hypothetical protein
LRRGSEGDDEQRGRGASCVGALGEGNTEGDTRKQDVGESKMDSNGKWFRISSPLLATTSAKGANRAGMTDAKTECEDDKTTEQDGEIREDGMQSD